MTISSMLSAMAEESSTLPVIRLLAQKDDLIFIAVAKEASGNVTDLWLPEINLSLNGLSYPDGFSKEDEIKYFLLDLLKFHMSDISSLLESTEYVPPSPDGQQCPVSYYRVTGTIEDKDFIPENFLLGSYFCWVNLSTLEELVKSLPKEAIQGRNKNYYRDDLLLAIGKLSSLGVRA